MCVCVCVCVYKWLIWELCVYVCVYTYHSFEYMYVCVYVYVYIYRSFEYMYVGIYTYIYSHTYTLVRALWCGLSRSRINQTDHLFPCIVVFYSPFAEHFTDRMEGRVEILLSFLLLLLLLLFWLLHKILFKNNINNNNNKQSIKLPSLFFSELLWRKVYKMMKVNLQLVLGFKVLDYFFGSIFPRPG